MRRVASFAPLQGCLTIGAAGAGAHVCETSRSVEQELMERRSLLAKRGPLAMLLQRACAPTCEVRDGSIRTLRPLEPLEPLTLAWPDGCIGDNTNKSGNYVRPCVCTRGCTRFVRDHRTARLTQRDRAAKGFAAKLATFVAAEQLFSSEA